MRRLSRLVIVIGSISVALVALTSVFRITRVREAADAIPVYPGAREGEREIRYLPRVFSWHDRSSARVQRVFALSEPTTLLAIARHAAPALGDRGWYLVMPHELERFHDPQVIVWQRDPDERLDLTQLWPISGMTRTERMYGGLFPPEFLDASLVIEWSWALGGPRSPRPAPQRALDVRRPIIEAPPPRR
jgi:hypothetical protein